MKKIFSVFISSFYLTIWGIPTFAQIPYYIPTDSLVAWYPFNDNANDESGNGHDGPNLFQKISHTPAYGRVKDEVANFGEALMQEVGKTAKTVVLPALMASVRNFIGDYLPNSSGSETSRQNASAGGEQNRSQEKTSPGYQPSLERGQA